MLYINLIKVLHIYLIKILEKLFIRFKLNEAFYNN